MKKKNGVFDSLLLGEFNEVLRKKRRRRRGGDSGSVFEEILLSNSSVSDSASIGDVIGLFSVSGGSGSYTFSLLGNPGNLFSISGNQLQVNASLSAGSDPIIVEADNGSDSVIQLFSINVVHAVVGYIPTYELLGF